MALGPQALPLGPSMQTGSVLDGPPPSPALPAMGQLGSTTANPGAQPSARNLPPEVVQGIVKSGESIGGMLDVIAQTAPDIANEMAAAKDMMLRGLGKLLGVSGGPLDPTAAGMNFPASNGPTGVGSPAGVGP